MQDERTVAIIQEIREEAIREQEEKVKGLQSQNEELSQKITQLEQQLQPLLLFEPILKQTYAKTQMLVPLKLDDQEQAYLWGIAQKW